MTPEELAERHPRLFHLTHPDAVAGIRRRGLWPTSRLLDLFGVQGEERIPLEQSRRPDSILLTHDAHGRVMITDNQPLDEAKLASVLDDDLKPADWLSILNRRVFFWVDEDRAMGLRHARAYRNQPRILLAFDTAEIADRYGAAMEIAPINTGATLYNPTRRGLSTFAPLGSTDYAVWRRRRGLSRPDKIVEVAVVGEMPDVMECLRETRE